MRGDGFSWAAPLAVAGAVALAGLVASGCSGESAACRDSMDDESAMERCVGECMEGRDRSCEQAREAARAWVERSPTDVGLMTIGCRAGATDLCEAADARRAELQRLQDAAIAERDRREAEARAAAASEQSEIEALNAAREQMLREAEQLRQAVEQAAP